MEEFTIPCPEPFHFIDVVRSHGWLMLLPYEWDEARETLSRVDLSPQGSPVRTELSSAPKGVRMRTEGDPDEAVRRARWLLALDEELGAFHELCASEPGLRTAGERGRGRILRCPTVWEDLAKTLFSVNTTWSQTVSMTRHLVTLYGTEHADGGRAFPGPERIAALDPAEVQLRCRTGYRAGVLSGIARDVVDGKLDLEAMKDRSVPTEHVERRLLGIRGIGPYAAANVLMLLGHYDRLPVDSWFRKLVRDAWFEGGDVSDRAMVAAFDRFRPYRTLAYQFYDWKRAAGEGSM